MSERYLKIFDLALEVIDPHLTPASLEAMLVEVEGQRGTSRARGKASAIAFQALASLWAGEYATPPRLNEMLAWALDIDPVDATDTFADSDEAGRAALKLIVAPRAPGKATPHFKDRQTAFALLQWYGTRGWVPPEVVINAVGILLGVLDIETMRLADSAARVLLGSANPARTRRAQKADAISRIHKGRELTEPELTKRIPETDRTLLAQRKHPGYILGEAATMKWLLRLKPTGGTWDSIHAWIWKGKAPPRGHFNSDDFQLAVQHLNQAVAERRVQSQDKRAERIATLRKRIAQK